MAWQPRETLRRTIVNANGEWLGLHRGLGGEHRAPGWRRRRNPWLAYVGPGVAAAVTAGAILLALSGASAPKASRTVVFPPTVATVLPSSGPSGASPEGPPLLPSAHVTDGRTAGQTTAATGPAPEMAGAPVPALSPTPTPAATTAAADAPPPLPPPVPVLTSTPPVCPPLPTPGKSKKAKPSHPPHW